MNRRIAALVIGLSACHRDEPRVPLDDFLRSDGHVKIVKLADSIQASAARGDCAAALVDAAQLSATIDNLVPPAKALMGKLNVPPPLPSPELVDYYMALQLDAHVFLAGWIGSAGSDSEPHCEDLAGGVPGVRGVRKYRPGDTDAIVREHR